MRKWSKESAAYLCKYYDSITVHQMRGRLYFLSAILYPPEAIYSKAQALGLMKDYAA